MMMMSVWPNVGLWQLNEEGEGGREVCEGGMNRRNEPQW